MSAHTMRELWEDVRKRHASIEAMGNDGPYLFCGCCDENWPCIDHWNATAALKMLDADHRYRCGPGCPDCDIHQSRWRSTNVRVSIIPDPESA